MVHKTISLRYLWLWNYVAHMEEGM
jgi:hypothetical protein